MFQKSNQLIFYVYAYIRKSNGTPYYIGKGREYRAFENHRYITVPKDKTKIVFLETNLSDIGSLALERRLIRWWGRKDTGTGILLNRTDGGEGAAGRVVTEQTKEKLRVCNIGKKMSEEQKIKISVSLKGRKNHSRKSIKRKLVNQKQEELYLKLVML